MKKYSLPLILPVVFETVAVTLRLTGNNLFFQYRLATPCGLYAGQYAAVFPPESCQAQNILIARLVKAAVPSPP